MFSHAFSHQAERDQLLDKEIWNAEEIGIEPNHASCLRKLNFTKIKPEWLNIAVKRFVRLQSSVRTINTCRTYITTLIHFGDFIRSQSKTINAIDIDRSFILDYVCYINKLKLRPASKRSILINLRTFLELCADEGWLPISKERMISDRDLPFLPEPIPNFVPDFVLRQLEIVVEGLEHPFKAFFKVMIETGRRVSEICTLPYNCISFDHENDPFMTVLDTKTKKEITIPISAELLQTINEHKAIIEKYGCQAFGVLFLNYRNKHNKCYTGAYINRKLVDLAKKHKITDINGNIWHFSSHQFRHTVGTRMINSGVSQHLVQKYLGHESPTMTSRYAKIHDKTMKTAFQSFQKMMINVSGEDVGQQANSLDAQWVKKNVLAQALPNGYCRLPLQQQRCPHANACLTCTHFCTTKNHLSSHEKQLQETMKLIQTAKENGWQRQVEMNEAVKDNLVKIICKLKYDH